MGYKVLIVDDEKEMRNLLTVCLKPSGYHIELAQTGFDALQKLTVQKFNLIILDMMTPTEAGFEILRKIRERNGNDVSIIMIAALGETEWIEEGLRLGANDYIVKPFEPNEVIAKIYKLVKKH
ncbi:response regulator [Anaerobacillus sp. CMMVII]|uniref:response regulator transcription factor n=1 Tax=Anaerobacillus sp. CMMVII TaxID=2755588 RepID=UPI0021B8014B|nr:response regulator [Anaerobacillus sp. CMMVII]MCT8137732.1 response regulator [Anaerobacillus sp. CMMVII]